MYARSTRGGFPPTRGRKRCRRAAAPDHRRRKSLESLHAKLVDDGAQCGGRVGDALVEGVNLCLPDLAMLLVPRRRRNLDL